MRPAADRSGEPSHPTSYVAAAVLSLVFVAVCVPFLATLQYDFDEAWMVLDARSILHGQRPFVDFPHHEFPLHLYLLALSGRLFGETLVGFRMLSVLAMAGSGFLLFCLTQPFVGAIAAIVAQGVLLFSTGEVRALTAVPETPALFLGLLGSALLLLGRTRSSAVASGVVFVLALLERPTSLAVVAAAALSLAYARRWRRLVDLALAGGGAAAAGLAWAIHLSDGVFGEILRFQLQRIGTRRTSIWTMDSAFSEIRRFAKIDTPWQLALSAFRDFYQFPATYLPAGVFALSFLGVPFWVARCARGRPAMQAFAVLFPLSCLAMDFLGVDFVSPRYFIPFLAFSGFCVAGLVWAAERTVPRSVAVAAGVAICIGLGASCVATLRRSTDAWYYGRSQWIAENEPAIVSFTPMLFASTGAAPACGLSNPVLTYGAFGEALFSTERTRRFRFDDDRVVACLRAHRDAVVVIDWAFYVFARPGAPLRTYLAGEGSTQRLFFSPESMNQWSRPGFPQNPFR